MSISSKSATETIIKSKKRVQNHGEVFTPKKTIKQMLDLPNIREACQNISSTFLEPAAGEGAFLVEILKRKLHKVSKTYNDNLTQFENYSLLALSTLYGVELLEDNAQKCVMNMYQVYFEAYQKQAREHNKKVKNKVLESAKLIISKNIAQGNFLNKLAADGGPIIFNEWKAINLRKEAKTIRVQRTEYTIEDILGGVEKEKGLLSNYSLKDEQLSLFNSFEEEAEIIEKKFQYVPVTITDVYKEEVEEVDG